MKLALSPPLAAPTRRSLLKCAVAGYGFLRAGAPELASLRRAPGACRGAALGPGILKHADDQTVAAVATLLATIDKLGWQERSFRDWGVLAAPNFFGRYATVQTLRRFTSEGAWGVSPHMIPHHSLHAVSGTISQILQIHGPNLGVSGGPAAAAEAFLVAATMAAQDNLPGIWLLLTGFEPEYIPDMVTGKPQRPTCCHAAALALAPDASSGERVLQVRISEDRGPCQTYRTDFGASEPNPPLFTLGAFVAHLAGDEKNATGRWRLPAGGWIELAGDFGSTRPT